MGRYLGSSLLIVLVASVLSFAQGDGAVQSGPKEGAFLPGPFDCYNFTGIYKGRYHCMVCGYGLDPAILVFAREPGAKDAEVLTLLKRLDDAVTVQFKRHEFKAGVVFLDRDAQSSATNSDELDPGKLVDEAQKRDEVYKRISERAATVKGVDVGVFPGDSPKGYNINPKTEVTVLFYTKLKVVMNRAYVPGALNEAEIDKIMTKVKETLEPAKKKG
jgi:hypothetical protein